MSDNNSNGSGVGFPALLTILFIGLKLTGYISWSWLWVLSPIWITFVIALIVIVVMAIVAVISDKH